MTGAPEPRPPLRVKSGGLSWTRARLPRRLSMAGKALYVGGSALSGFGFLPGLLGLTGLAALAAVLGVPMLVLSYVLGLTQTWSPGHVEVGNDRLFVFRGGGEQRFALDQIVSALVVLRPLDGGAVPTVEIEVEGGDLLTVRTADLAEARALVEALGFGPRGRRVRARLGRPTRRLFHAGFGLPLYSVLTTIATAAVVIAGTDTTDLAFSLARVAGPLVAIAAYELLRRALRAPEVMVGDDGVVVARGFGRDRASSGAPRQLGGLLLDEPRLAAVLDAAAERRRLASATPERRARFARAGRSIAEWRRDLAGGLEDAGYRTAAAPRDEAESILRSSDASPEERVGAALALRLADEPPARIRVAAEAMADDGLRAALEAVAEGEDDAALERALRRAR